MVKNQNRVIWIQIVSLYKQKQIILIKKLQEMLKLDFILQIMNQIDHYLKKKTKKVIGKIMIKFVLLIAKTYSYLIDDSSDDKKFKDTEKCFIKRKLMFEN